MNIQITATNFAVPKTRQSASEIAELVGRDESWVNQNVGVANRHVCKLGQDPAELATEAASPIVEQHGDPDLLIYASASVRQCIPDTSVFVALQLGLSGIPAFSINATCLSFLVALRNAASLIETGVYEKILIVTAELPTLSRNFAHAESAALFGDGAAAVMVEATERPSGIEHFRQVTWPQCAEMSQIRGGGLLLHPTNEITAPEDYLFEMDGNSLLRIVLPRMMRFLKQFFASCEFDIADIDLIIPHQASAAGMKLLAKVGMPPERTIDILNDYGNCVSASIPMALAMAEQQGKVKRGDHILLLGTAAGLSIGAAILKW
ncbi:MAG: 3-oxoacyl-ACP synthase III family protein [Mariniblastus sp.]